LHKQPITSTEDDSFWKHKREVIPAAQTVRDLIYSSFGT
jgi:hypothetical protein